jgi:hypothetical protein
MPPDLAGLVACQVPHSKRCMTGQEMANMFRVLADQGFQSAEMIRAMHQPMTGDADRDFAAR